MSLPSSASQQPSPPVVKQGISVYTVMLILSFVCICVACTLLYLEIARYGGFSAIRAG